MEPSSSSAPDHREIARRLRLFHQQDEAPGMVFWHPAGLHVVRRLEEAARRHVAAQGYREVRTPQVMRRSIWESSGHWQHFAEGMLRFAHSDAEDPSLEAALKPVSCPAHIQLLQRDVLSYRALPVRLAEFGVVHRDEPSGTLHGLLRLRRFTQDDGHVFCRHAQAEEEVRRYLRGVRRFYRAFGFESLELALSLRPSDRAGSDASWDEAEAILARALEAEGERALVQPGAGAFYGPKIELALRDRAGRSWQCGTIQVDLVMPARFDLRYVDERGERVHPVMLHRALYGSVERFLGVLLEHHGAELPPWLVAEPVRVVPVHASDADAAYAWAHELREEGIEVGLDDRELPLGARLRSAREDAIPHVVVLGARELAEGRVTLRQRDVQSSLERDAARRFLVERCSMPAEVGAR